MKTPSPESATSRRQFLELALAGSLGGVTVLAAPPAPQDPPAAPPVRCAVVGVGLQGRRILTVLAGNAAADVKAVCDVYPPYLSRGKRLTSGANDYSDYREMLEQEKDLEAVLVATPSHLHREILEATLAAGRHVYCEAPMASSLEDARVMTEASRQAKTTLAVGLDQRSNPNYEHALKFVQADAIGRLAQATASFHVNNSWRRTVGDKSFEKAMNWRLDPEVSPGLTGELGVHAFDTVLRASGQIPSAVTSFGSIMKWRDGREVQDSVQCVFEFASGFHLHFQATLANSYAGQYQLLHGTDGSILLTEDRCWMFKEADAKALGWEVYARRERVGVEEGIVLVANATKLLAQSKLPGEAAAPSHSPEDSGLKEAVGSFLRTIRNGGEPDAGAEEGFRSLVLATAARESLRSGKRVELTPEMFKV